jgi:alpha-L-fucosidase
MEDLSDGTFRFTVTHSGKVLDVAGLSTADGAGVIQWPWNGGPNQRWRRQTV